MILQRFLDEIETNMMGAAPTHAVEYVGTLRKDALDRAVDVLCDRYPVLRGRIVPHGNECLLYSDSTFRPELRVRHGDHSTLLHEAQTSWDPHEAVVRFLLVLGTDRGFVGMRIDHAIVDGAALRKVFEDLWSIYSDVVNGLDLTTAPERSLPASPCNLLRERWNSKDARVGPSGEAERRPDAVRRRVRPHQGRVRLTMAATSRLVEITRDQGTSVFATVCGVLLLAQRAKVSSPAGVPMACLSHVGLRNRVVPPVAATATTNFVGMHDGEIAVPVDGSPIDIGRQVRRHLDLAIQQHQLMPLGFHDTSLRDIDPASDQRFVRVMVSSNGIIHPDLRNPPGLALVDILIPNDTMTATCPGYSIGTFQGRLSIRYLFPSDLFKQEDVTDLISLISTNLANALNDGQMARSGSCSAADLKPEISHYQRIPE